MDPAPRRIISCPARCMARPCIDMLSACSRWTAAPAHDPCLGACTGLPTGAWPKYEPIGDGDPEKTGDEKAGVDRLDECRRNGDSRSSESARWASSMTASHQCLLSAIVLWR